jgi:four helix bundle protein
MNAECRTQNAERRAENTNERPQDLHDRLMRFIVRIMRLGQSLPRSPEAQQVRKQMFDSSSSTGANYSEARAAESALDFVHKMQVVLKELRETDFWLRLIVAAEMVPPSKMTDVLRESDELIRIFVTSINTARGKRR